MAQNNWEADKMLDVYIHDYLLKRNLQATAKAFKEEGKVSAEPVGEQFIQSPVSGSAAMQHIQGQNQQTSVIFCPLLQDIKGDIGAVQKSLHKDPSSLYSQGIMQAKSGLSGAGKQLHWKFMKGFLLHVRNILPRAGTQGVSGLPLKGWPLTGTRKRKSTSSGAANSAGMPSANSPPSTPSIHTTGDGVSMASNLQSASTTSKSLMMYGVDRTGGLASSNQMLCFGRSRSISIVSDRLKEKSIVGGRLREKSIVDGQLREKKRRRKRGEERRGYIPPFPPLSSPARRPHPRVILLPRDKTECLPARGERSRRHRRARTVFTRTPSSPVGDSSPARGNVSLRGEKDRGD
ncbi:hypothetical protein BHM03_00052205, partial [Ensete ventricosum]